MWEKVSFQKKPLAGGARTYHGCDDDDGDIVVDSDGDAGVDNDVDCDGDDGDGIPHICHRHHRRCLCKFFLPGVIFFQIEREKLAFYCIVYNNLRPSV